CGPPALLCLATIHGVIAWQWRGRWREGASAAAGGRAAGKGAPMFGDRAQFLKAVGATAVLLGLFLTPVPREIGALAVAAVLLASRRVASRDMIVAVDWNLLLLFVGLFMVTGALGATPAATSAVEALSRADLLPDR